MKKTLNKDKSTIETASSFTKLSGKKESTFSVDGTGNYIIFMISGEVEVVNNKNATTLMKPQHMYTACSLCAPFSFKAVTDFESIVLAAGTLANHVNATNVMKILNSKLPMCRGLPELQYSEVIESFVQSILLVIDQNNLASESLYDIKKMEFLYYIAQMYSHEEVVVFAYGIASTYSKFKIEVYSKYNNAINVEQLATSMHMTTKTFTRNFKKEFNTTPNGWILEQRLFNLNHCIINKRMTLEKLLEEFNFSSVSVMRQFLRRNNFEHLLPLIY